jgi:hypothetical protein
MASAALSRPQITVLPLTDAHAQAGAPEMELCDQLLAHMLECDLCLDPEQPTCAVCVSLQSQVKAEGGPSRGVVFAF